MSPLLAVIAWAAPALAADTAQTLTYDLVLNGAVVGTREVSIRYMEPFTEYGTESRLIASWTELDAHVGAFSAQVQNRASAHITNSSTSFTSSVSLNGALSEVQGSSLPDGRWDIHSIVGRQRSNQQLRRTEVDMSTMDLLDPVRAQHLTTLSEAHIFSVETGEVMTGPVVDMGEQTITVAGEYVSAHVWSWTPEIGRFEMAWSRDGLLLDWKAEIQGQTIHGRLQELPPPRSFGEATTFSAEMPSFTEEEL